MKINKYWFKQKIFGYGAYPISWEGWILMGLFLITLIYLVNLIEKTNNYSYSIIILTIIALLGIISYKKTQGNFKFGQHFCKKLNCKN